MTSNGAPWGYDNAAEGGFEDRGLVKIEQNEDPDGMGPYWRVNEGGGHYVQPFATERAAEEWAWQHSYRWTETKEEMEETGEWP